MPFHNKTGQRIAAAGTAAAALALAAGAPAFAQTAISGFELEFSLYGPEGQPTVNSQIAHDPQAASVDLAFSPAEAPDFEAIDVDVSFAEGDGIVELTTDDEYCTVDHLRLVCHAPNTGGTFDSGAIAFDFTIALGQDANAGTSLPYDIAASIATADTESTEYVSGDLTFAPELFQEEDDEETPLPDDFPVSDLEEADDAYGFAFLNYLLEGAEAGQTLTAYPHFRVNQPSALGDDHAATALFFSGSVSLEAWFDEENPTGSHTGNVNAIADYDNCTQWPGGILCIVEDFDPQVGTTYTLSADTPLGYEVLNAVGEDEGAYYTAWDINDATVDLFRRFVFLDSDDQLRLVESEEAIGDEYFSEYYGLVFFTENGGGLGGVTPTDPPETDEAADPKLPSTGNSSVILVSAAAAAIAAGAVVFVVLRRRRLAQNWE